MVFFKALKYLWPSMNTPNYVSRGASLALRSSIARYILHWLKSQQTLLLYEQRWAHSFCHFCCHHRCSRFVSVTDTLSQARALYESERLQIKVPKSNQAKQNVSFGERAKSFLEQSIAEQSTNRTHTLRRIRDRTWATMGVKDACKLDPWVIRMQLLAQSSLKILFNSFI